VENPFIASYWREMAEDMRTKAEIIRDGEAKRIMFEIVGCYEELARHLEAVDPHRQESDAKDLGARSTPPT
jgi:hypothetical protein